MKKYILAPQAEKDLSDIFDYTIDQWGEDQARKYAGELKDKFETLTERPGLGKPRPEIRPYLRSLASGSHVIFYREGRDCLEIMRILHSARDIQSILR